MLADGARHLRRRGHRSVHGRRIRSPQFWTQFDDDELDTLVDRCARRESRPAHRARARVKKRARCDREARFDLAPTVNASGGYTKQRTLGAEQAAAFGRERSSTTRASMRSWELDFFGRVRRGVEAVAHAGARRVEASLRDAQVIVTAEVTRTYFELRGAAEPARGRATQRREPAGDAESHQVRARRRPRHGTRHLARPGSAQHARSRPIAPLEAAVSRDHPSAERAHRP